MRLVWTISPPSLTHPDQAFNVDLNKECNWIPVKLRFVLHDSNIEPFTFPAPQTFSLDLSMQLWVCILEMRWSGRNRELSCEKPTWHSLGCNSAETRQKSGLTFCHTPRGPASEILHFTWFINSKNMTTTAILRISYNPEGLGFHSAGIPMGYATFHKQK